MVLGEARYIKESGVELRAVLSRNWHDRCSPDLLQVSEPISDFSNELFEITVKHFPQNSSVHLTLSSRICSQPALPTRRFGLSTSFSRWERMSQPSPSRNLSSVHSLTSYSLIGTQHV